MLLCSTLAWSQDASADEMADTAATTDQVGDIVVTAQKRSENLQQVPIAITAFTGDTLKSNQINTAADLAQYTPNLHFSTAGGGSSTSASFYIRGIGQHIFHFTADPAVGIYFDDVYVARSMGANFDLGDIAQVDVLKGPQGTLFGRNTIGGAVSIQTNKPNFDFGGNADVTVGTIDQLLVHGTINVPIVNDKLALRVTAMGDVRDGWGKDTAPSGKTYDLGQSRIAGGRAQLLWKPTNDLDILVTGDGMHQRGNITPEGLIHFTATPASDAFNATSPVKIGPQWLAQGYDSFLYVKPDDDVDTAGGAVTMTYHPGSLTIKSISSYRWQHVVASQDYGGVPVPYLGQQTDQRQWQVSQELQATGDLLGGRLKYTFGLYYFKESAKNGEYAAIQGADLFIPLKTEARSFAAYGQATYDVTDKLSITGGARWTDEHKNVDVTTILGGAVLVPQSHVAVSYQPVTPMGNIKYQWSPNVMTYASIAKGFRSGAFSALPFAASDLIPTRPEKSVTYEVGGKFDALDHKVRLNIAAFYDDYTDIQIGATTETDGLFVFRTANAAKATIYGGEAELTAVLAPGLEAYVNGSYLHSRLSAVAGFSFGVSKLPSAPKYIVDAGIKYGFDLGGRGKLTVGVDGNFRTKSYPQFNPAPESEQKAYGLANGRIIYEPANSPWTFTIWGKNLTDKKYNVFGQTAGSGDVSVGWFGRPIEGGATAAVKF
jgi:iron complex outermembrane receptor protein